MLSEHNSKSRINAQADKYSLSTFIQPSLRPCGLRSPLFMDRICAVLGATPHEIRSQRHNKDAAKRRWAIAYVMHHTKGRDIFEIAQFLQNDKTTIKHGLSRAADIIETDEDFRSMVHAIDFVA